MTTRLLVGVATGLLIFVVIGCAPLPGRTLDPLTLASGVRGDEPPPERDQWLGRFQDSRGSGELDVQIRRTTSAIEGVWRLRTGGDGVVTGTRVPNSSVVKFQLATQGGTCFLLLEGVGNLTADHWEATYDGRDCHGQITNGRLSLKKR